MLLLLVQRADIADDSYQRGARDARKAVLSPKRFLPVWRCTDSCYAVTRCMTAAVLHGSSILLPSYTFPVLRVR
eukprot:3940837-Rhodomonas_salina.2